MRNLVVIILDDLRAELPGPYRCPKVSAPNIEALASESVTFLRAYAQEALCAPSRNSFLTGRMPDQTQSWQFVDHFREVGPDWTSLPELFKNAGYTTVGAGKVFHPGLPPNWDFPYSWDSRMNGTIWDDWLYPSEPKCPQNTSWCGDEDTAVYQDTQTSAQVAELLQNVTEPYFLAAGFRKPHLQWRFPSRFLDVVPPDNASAVPYAPAGAPPVAFHMPYDELSGLSDFTACGGAGAMAPFFAYPKDCQIEWRTAYRASVAFADELVGELMAQIDDDAIVALFGDHGWHLGDLGEWEKFTNYENAVRVPLMIRAKGLVTPSVDASLVELVDLYPTLANLAGLDFSYVNDESAPLAGVDVFSAKKMFARSQFPRCVGGENYNANFTRNASYPDWYMNDCNDVPKELFTHMGYTIRDLSWRFTAWFPWDGPNLQPVYPPVALELYDHREDDGTCDPPHAFDGYFEATNLANQSAYAKHVDVLLLALTDIFHIRTPLVQ